MIRDIARLVALGGVFLLPFLPLVVTNSLFFPFITGKNFLFRIVVEVVFAAWVILALYDARYRPKFSYILAGFCTLIVVMFAADLFGVAPHKSFWSNYERMEGFVTLAHLLLYFVVAGSILTTDRLWNAFWNTSIVVAGMMMLYGFCQLSGSASCPISQSETRIDGRMGNSAYLAIYMLFHIFMSALLLVRARATGLRVLYGLLAFGFTYILFTTQTRGTTAALMGGILVAAAYIVLYEKSNQLVRRIALGGLVAVVILVGAFYMARGSEFVQGNEALRRLSSMFSVSALDTRVTIWSLAVEGVKERPILGWGQENFNYVFNKHYSASLYAQEPWFDRVHNLVFDWLIAGGVLGLLAYLSVLLSSIYYLIIRPHTHPDEERFTTVERGLLLGLLAGYTAHNLLVFDNLISYFFFASVIAMIHTRAAREIPSVRAYQMNDQVLGQIAAPVVVGLACVVIYVVNVPSLQAASDMIKGFQVQDPSARIAHFERALERGSFANQEIREQTVRIAQEFSNQSGELVKQMRTQNPKLSQADAEKQVADLRARYSELAEKGMKTQLAETPDDVRILIFQASFYRGMGRTQDAIPVLERAKEISPEKQQIYFELGLAYADKGEYEKAAEIFKTAYELEPSFSQARMFYAAGLIYKGDLEAVHALITPQYALEYAKSEVVTRALLERKNYTELEQVFTTRIENAPSDLQMRVSLAYVQNMADRKDDAIATIRKAIEDFPSFKQQGEQYIASIEASPAPKQ